MRFESAVLVELERRSMSAAYVRTPDGHEVDFVARRPGGGEELIQVTADATDAATAALELRALADAGRRYPKATKRLLTLRHDGLPSSVPSDIVAQPAYEWLLAAPGED